VISVTFTKERTSAALHTTPILTFLITYSLIQALGQAILHGRYNGDHQ